MDQQPLVGINAMGGALYLVLSADLIGDKQIRELSDKLIVAVLAKIQADALVDKQQRSDKFKKIFEAKSGPEE